MTEQTHIRADFSKREILSYDEVDWTPSPAPGVHRKMLDRIGGEVARATSIVRYEPGSSFEEHEHGGGEEILVLDGVFSDESGDYPAGTYLRNPPGSRHAPGSEPGCIIFVKLWQFDPDDDRQVARPIDSLDWLETRPGTSVASLHNYEDTTVKLVRLAEGTRFSTDSSGGLECLLFDGQLAFGERALGPWSWLRVPDEEPFSVTAKTSVTLYVKSGHLEGTS
jgi:anti-sigma factor ChrR (cupin superfamily)